ncbi:hypothetical protein [Streptomyces sp. WAC06614]|uniref:hypothetical protein n=1 Tax=Streptomyces sp. WAC06614 TaxID=2487416 RepID=UPI000F768D2D|nr:hypothetical protein [Streptomyces sp. WAC06614]RSS73335.1 hypothetical protein EF918_25680 [Streptomyces sp. WAC06614]
MNADRGTEPTVRTRPSTTVTGTATAAARPAGTGRAALSARRTLLAAALATGLSVGVGTAFGPAAPQAAAAAPAAAPGRAAGQGVDCAEVRAEVERLEGRITPNACAFMKRQLTFGSTATGTPPAPGDLAHPRVKAYLDIFDPDATLWEAGGPPQHGREAIGTSITHSLRLAPDLRYGGTTVVADGAVMMFGQWNEVTLRGRKIAYPQIARNLLGDDGRTVQARRYYDRYVLFTPLAPELRPRPLFDGIADSGRVTGATPQRFRADEIEARLAAWNHGDVAALTGRTGRAPLSGPGLTAPLATDAGKTAYLERLFAERRFDFTAGQVAFGESVTYVEWHGTVTGPTGKDVPFGIVERFGPGGAWELTFDTLPLVADRATIGTLFQRLSQP